MTKGSPKEQEQEGLEGEYNKTVTDADINEENGMREVYDPVTKSIDWRKQKVTDKRDNPRVYLPRPRPNVEELELNTKEYMYNRTIDEYA